MVKTAANYHNLILNSFTISQIISTQEATNISKKRDSEN